MGYNVAGSIMHFTICGVTGLLLWLQLTEVHTCLSAGVSGRPGLFSRRWWVGKSWFKGQRSRRSVESQGRKWWPWKATVTQPPCSCADLNVMICAFLSKLINHSPVICFFYSYVICNMLCACVNKLPWCALNFVSVTCLEWLSDDHDSWSVICAAVVHCSVAVRFANCWAACLVDHRAYRCTQYVDDVQSAWIEHACDVLMSTSDKVSSCIAMIA